MKGYTMTTYILIGVVLVLCIFVIIYMCKYHANYMFSLLLRTIFGLTCVYLINSAFKELEIATTVGVNLISIIVIGLLGIPGIILLYGGTFLLKK